MKVNTSHEINIEYDGSLYSITTAHGISHFRDLEEAIAYLHRTMRWWSGVMPVQKETLF